ncbi:G/T mismatch-specific thymine DNA glycosylase [Ambystoma mexicanum]|uniref:G/T mismatch-specific thymine DNA glycosylase n=1 Tax=Ambystoma mexicanum TaxID=8296 RepID=UPI0037E8AF38
MEAQDPSRYYSLQPAPPYFTFPFHQMMNPASSMESMSEQQSLHTVTGVPAHEYQTLSAAPGYEQTLQTLTSVPAYEHQSMMGLLNSDIKTELAEEPPKAKGKKGKSSEPKASAPKVPKMPKEPKPPKAPKEPKPPKPPKTPKAPKSNGKQEKITDAFKVKRKVDRFKGVTEAELLTKTLPDILTFNLDIVIIGINPGLMAAYKGHHYPGPGNHFWKCLFLSGLSDQQLTHTDDHSLPEKFGIGFTNMVERTTPGSKDLSSKDFREGGRILLHKLQKYKPKIAVFNGKCIYEMFSKEVFGIKIKQFDFGLQPHKVPETETLCYVMPSSSARCAQFPRAQDKVHHYLKLKHLRDEMKGIVQPREVMEVQYSFDLELAKEDAKRQAVKEEKYDPGYEDADGGVNGETMPAAQGERCNFSLNGTVSSNPEFSEGSSFGPVPNGQWTSPPDFGGCDAPPGEGSSA